VDNNNNGQNNQQPYQQQPQYQQPPQQYQQPYQQQQPYYPPPVQAAPTSGKAIAGLVFGILGLVFFWIPYFNIAILILCVVGLILCIGAQKVSPGGVATAGLVLCIVGLALSAIGAIWCTIAAVSVCNTVYW